MRLFVAVDLDAPARAAVADAVARLRDRAERRSLGLARGVKWVDPRNLHLTLHFIGEIGDDRVPGLRESLACPLGIDPARVGFSGWGVFPARGAARVIWTGVTRGVATLERAHAVIGKRLEAAGVAPEARGFSPHLTIGRVKVPSGAWGDVVRDASVPLDCECDVFDCTLYRSHLSAGGPTYEILLRTPFLDAAGTRPAGEKEGQGAG